MYAVPKIPDIRSMMENFRIIAICSLSKFSLEAT